jgi:Zn-finger domain associated with topoisomerase type I
MWMYLFTLFFIIALFVIYAFQNKRYKKTEYYEQTKNSYISVLFDKGRLGEFYTYQYLKPLDGYRRYLFNLYIPKEKGETTELDVVLLHESGIYVFESKNYSGWIFGTESQKYWTQTLPVGNGRSQKNKFFNPILQNKGHLKWLKAFLADQTLPFYSYIVFSDRCTLKNIKTTSEEHCVVNRYHLLAAVRHNIAKTGGQLSREKIDSLFEILYPLTQIDEAVKMAHIKNIQQKTQDGFSKPAPVAVVMPKTEEPVCPRCGEKLVIRIAKKGERQGKQFWGCSNFPKCRYTEEMADTP